jgi:L-asparagine transporter-like permease
MRNILYPILFVELSPIPLTIYFYLLTKHGIFILFLFLCIIFAPLIRGFFVKFKSEREEDTYRRKLKIFKRNLYILFVIFVFIYMFFCYQGICQVNEILNLLQ